ncbi:MAG: hypothetical protein CEN91_540 [Candidatus Berkelbacteria bacterium Licking1014_85]|uniref:Uncharacterized protein n=1 Tax=Candidatus Berkelbacteria bacterium Licking1014_85 TaxID=2017148 RepID=A0A554LH39_9BACT|nr:MAG: hypothetical protein CEN91_540 [Candidatus Berkelbacteria bacterium Licking1014_85]
MLRLVNIFLNLFKYLLFILILLELIVIYFAITEEFHPKLGKNSNFPPCKIKFEPIIFRNALIWERSPCWVIFFANFERKIKSLIDSSRQRNFL